MTRGEIIKTIRMHSGLNQHEFGRRVAATKSTVCRWEKEQRKPNFKKAKNIIEMSTFLGLGYTMYDILGEHCE